jgi:hypothetical protein
MVASSLRFSPRYVPLLLALTGCGIVTVRTGGQTTPAGGGAATEGPGAAAESDTPAKQEQREKAKAWSGKCSVAYDDFMTAYGPLDAESRKAIAETRDKPFYDAYPRLAGQYRKLRKEMIRLHGSNLSHLETTYGYGRGAALDLLLAIADLQIKTGYLSEIPFSPSGDIFLASFPMTGDAAFDRNVFCVHAASKGLRAPEGGPGKLEAYEGEHQGPLWMTGTEHAAFMTRSNELREKTRLALNLLIEKRNEWIAGPGRNYGGDDGAVKQVKAQPDGTTLLSCKALDTPYTCAHTGNYRWNGVAFNDCDVVDLPTRETYAFTVSLKELPSVGIKAGDKITFSGNNPKGRSADAKVGAAWDSAMVRVITRKGKQILETDLLDKLDSLRFP